MVEYNKKEIKKNMDLLRESTNECISKLESASDDEKELLRRRLRVNSCIAEFVLKTLRDLPQDKYLGNVISDIEHIMERWLGYF